MEELMNQVIDSPLSIVVLATWVVALYRQNAKLTSELFGCLEDLKRRNQDD